MIYKMESRVLLMRITTVLVCFNQLIHQLGQYSWHLMLNASEQNASQLISQSADTKIGRRQSRPDTRFKECGSLGAYLLERISGLRFLDHMPPEIKLQLCVNVACQSVHSQRISLLQKTFGPRNDSEGPFVDGQLRVDNVADELELGVQHGVHDCQDDGVRFVQVELS